MSTVSPHAPEVCIEVIDTDLPRTSLSSLRSRDWVAIDSETTGLDWAEDKLALIQVYMPSQGRVYLVRISGDDAPNLSALIESSEIKKVFHHAMFDLRFLVKRFKVRPANIACTKIASKIVSPDRQRHSLSDLVEECFGVKLDKSVAVSDWLAPSLTDDQLTYASEDVIFLPSLLERLIESARSENIRSLIEASFAYIPFRARLDIAGVGDVFTY